jgi:hypothetical protein
MKHSKLILIISLLFVLPISVYAVPGPGVPKFDFGIKVGANFAKLDGDAWQQNMQPGLMGGAFIGVRSKKIGLQLEAMVNSSKYSLSGVASGGDFKTTNLELPLLLQYKLLPYVWLQLGPQYSMVMSTSVPDGSTITDLFKNSFCGVFGVELKTPIKFNIGVRYILGLTDVNNVSSQFSGAWQQRSVQVHLGFRLF